MLMLIVAASAQLNFNPQKSLSFAGFYDKFNGDKLSIYNISDPVGRQIYSPIEISAVSENTDEEIISTEKIEVKSNSKPVSVDVDEMAAMKVEINLKPTAYTYPANPKGDIGISSYPTEKIMLYAQKLKEFAKKNNYDTSYAFFCNMGMLCNKKRFFVVNLVTMRVERSGLVSHGRGQGLSIFDKQYSNKPGSRCTALGRYKITKKYKGTYGDAYKMIGLDSTNEDAYDRNIVLHSMKCIPDTESYKPACLSDGCPAVSENFLYSLNRIIESRNKPVLLWIFDSNLEEMVIEKKPIPQYVSK
jgi:hypothetical protein